MSMADTVIANQINRLARSLQDLLWIVETLVKKGVSVKFHKKNLVFDAGMKKSEICKE